MTEQTSNAANEIKDLESGEERKVLTSNTQGPNSSVMRDGSRAPAGSPSERRWRRKNDITTSHGLAREHARLIAAMHNGRVSLDAGDILSRAYGRQRDLVATTELKASISGLAQQIADLKRERSVVSVVQGRKR